MIIPDEILLQVDKPARYIGNEINMVQKELKDIDIRFAFAFPDVYEVGMSHLGLQILYYFLNERKDTFCERVFAPWIDMEKVMREHNFGLVTLETQDYVNKFDFLGFTLQYEMSFTNILNMIELSGLELLSKDRKDSDTIICAGGPCAYNPEPLAEFVDFFYIGEGEVVLYDILDKYKENKAKNGTKEEFLFAISQLEGVYVPRFYDTSYNTDGTIKEFKPIKEGAPSIVKKVIVKDLDKSFYPEKQLVPLIETVHDRVTLEVFRGCIRGCRFCQAGYVYRPVREKHNETLIDQSVKLIDNSGHEEISLVSLSTSDYTEFEPLANGLLDTFKDKKVNLSLPSMRIDSMSIDIMQKIQEVRKSSLTFAPEAGTQRMRDVINKGITEEEILHGSGLAFANGWNRVKLYFMVGLPTEETEDLLGIVNLTEKVVENFYKTGDRSRGVNIVASSACFIPKPFTPFQWFGQNDMEEVLQKQKMIKSSFKKKQVKYNYHDAKTSIIEAVIARGDRKVGKGIQKAFEMGARFDSWGEHFNYNTWKEAFESVGIDMSFYANRNRETTEVLPWDFIDIGVSKKYFIKEWEKAQNSVITPDCREKCSNCGATKFEGGVCFE